MIATTADTAAIERPDLDKGLGAAGKFGFGAAILATLLYVAYSVYSDAAAAGVHATAFLPFILLFIALLIAAIIWNLATWWLGIPSSSSHTLIGSIIGVGVANAMLHGRAAPRASPAPWPPTDRDCRCRPSATC